MQMQSIPCVGLRRRVRCTAGAVVYSLETRRATDEHLRGGDVFDAYDRLDGSSTVMLADISSKGTLGKAQAEVLRHAFRRNACRERSPSIILAALNTLQLAGGRRSGDHAFATVFIATLTRTGEALCYASAGHDTALILRGRSHEHLAPTGPVIGVMGDASFADGLATFGPTDLLLVATDGFTECRSEDDDRRQFGTSGIIRALGATPPRSHRSVSRTVALSADVFTGERYRDDATLVAIRRNGSAERLRA
jgi:sigma-B regulation protein RsbU (phosphoserine phosphatase)